MRFYLTVERVQTVSSTMDPHSSAQIYGDLRKQGTPNSRILIIRTPNKVPLIFGNSCRDPCMEVPAGTEVCVAPGALRRPPWAF